MCFNVCYGCFMEEQTFKEFIFENIEGSGMRWDYAAVKLGVKYRTLLSWKNGERIPTQFTQDAVIEKINSWSIPTETEN